MTTLPTMERLKRVADAIIDAYREVNEGGHWSGTGGSITVMHRSNGQENDPTGQAYLHGGKQALRAKVREANRMVRDEVMPALKRLEDYLVTGTVDSLDAETREMLHAENSRRPRQGAIRVWRKEDEGRRGA